MNSPTAALERALETKLTQEHLQNLKSPNPQKMQPPTTKTPPRFLTNKQAFDKIDALESENATLKTALTSARAASRTPSAPRTASPRTAAPSSPTAKHSKPAARTITAAEFATPSLAMSRAEFAKLTPADRLRFSKSGGKITQ